MSKKYFILIFIVLSIYFSFFNLQKINLTSSDIGRHLKNGNIILHPSEYGAKISDLLHTNFFSTTYPNFPFVNHHWGYGVLAYLIYSLSGWDGLSIAYVVVMLGALYFSVKIAARKSSLWLWIPLALFLIPLMAERTEVRPEAISYFFVMLFMYILYRYREHELSEKYLWLLPVLMVLWVNMHIYFIFGIFVTGVFGFEAMVRGDWPQFEKLLMVTLATAIAACIGPYGIYGLVYPFTIFNNYGYLVAENQSIPFLQALHFVNPNFLWWQITTILMGLVTIRVLFKDWKKFPLALGIIAFTFLYLSFTAIRNLSLFGFVALPFLAVACTILIEGVREKLKKEIIWSSSIMLSIVIIIFSLIYFTNRLPSFVGGQANWGVGLLPNNLNSAEFARQAGITGPIFNNYDIGSYLIFNLYTPGNPEKVFVDNRPEAYPADFFNNTYIPMQQDNTVWKQQEAQWKFNTIWFYRLDMTPWAQQFLIARVQDPEWVPVFVDDYTIIFVRNISANTSIIQKYALPKSMFEVK